MAEMPCPHDDCWRSWENATQISSNHRASDHALHDVDSLLADRQALKAAPLPRLEHHIIYVDAAFARQGDHELAVALDAAVAGLVRRLGADHIGVGAHRLSATMSLAS